MLTYLDLAYKPVEHSNFSTLIFGPSELVPLEMQRVHRFFIKLLVIKPKIHLTWKQTRDCLQFTSYIFRPKIQCWIYHKISYAFRSGLDGPGGGGGVIVPTRPDRAGSSPLLLCYGYRVCFPRLKKDQSNTSTPPLDLHDLFYGELTLKRKV
jgi:hypothetical protein